MGFTKKMRLITFFPVILGVQGDLCAKIRLRENQPYGSRVNFNAEKEPIPDRTQQRLRSKGGCDDDDFAAFADRLEAKLLAPLRCRFPRPKNNNKTKDVMYIRCLDVRPDQRGESGKHDAIA